jgi:hypothetical protein
MTSLSASVSARMRRQGLLDDLLVFDVEEAASRSRRDGGVGDNVQGKDPDRFGDTYSCTFLDSTVYNVPATVTSELDHMDLEDKQYDELKKAHDALVKRLMRLEGRPP